MEGVCDPVDLLLGDKGRISLSNKTEKSRIIFLTYCWGCRGHLECARVGLEHLGHNAGIIGAIDNWHSSAYAWLCSWGSGRRR